MSAERLVVVLIGAGGVGKGTIARRLVARDPRLALSCSWTTRERRPSERGDEYVFTDEATFRRAVDEGRFLEWAEFHGHLYGTPVPGDAREQDLLLEIDVQGAEQVRAARRDAAVILIVPPSTADLEQRLRQRGDDDEHVRDRLASAAAEEARAGALEPFVVVNDDVESATSRILSILEGLRRSGRDRSPKD